VIWIKTPIFWSGRFHNPQGGFQTSSIVEVEAGGRLRVPLIVLQQPVDGFLVLEVAPVEHGVVKQEPGSRAVVAIPSIKSFSEGGKQGAAARNSSALNSAVAQYDQAGGLLTPR
jgi:hypothetical protein